MPMIDWTPGRGQRGRAARRILGMGQRQGLIVLSGLAVVMVLLATVAALGGFDDSAKAATGTQGSASGGSGADPAAGDGPGAATSSVPADPAKAVKLLQDSVQHYTDMFAAGQKIVGHTRYSDAKAYGEAFANIKSPAAAFAKYRTAPNPEGDSSYMAASTKAGAAFGSAKRPAALEKWSTDMGKVKDDLSAWVEIAVQYQQGAASQADLDAAAAKVGGDLAAAKGDVAAVGG